MFHRARAPFSPGTLVRAVCVPQAAVRVRRVRVRRQIVDEDAHGLVPAPGYHGRRPPGGSGRSSDEYRRGAREGRGEGGDGGAEGGAQRQSWLWMWTLKVSVPIAGEGEVRHGHGTRHTT